MSSATVQKMVPAMVGAATTGRARNSNPPDVCALTQLSRKEISMLQSAANKSIKTSFNYYITGLSLGLNYEI